MARQSGFQVDPAGRIPLDIIAGGGILLMARHAGDGVVQYDNCRIGLVVGDVGQGLSYRSA